MNRYIPTIGLEIHVQLKTRTKMFCDSLNDSQETQPNVNVCPVCMGHPGTLPVANKQAIEHVLRVGLALESQIATQSKFDRKNYFYPDLPKGYQISQYDQPFCLGGSLYIDVNGEHGETAKKIDIERIHLEEDTGRLLHSADVAGVGTDEYSFVDFNRAGIPLMELVTKPVIFNAREARKFAEELRLILRYLNVSDADMEKGQMRVEVNLSLAKESSEKLGTKVELKNLNSLRAVEDATAHEIERQTKLLNSSKKVAQETRGWDEDKKVTFSQRKKESAHDYRYFPEPDLPSILVTKEYGFDLLEVKASIPELPRVKRDRFMQEYNHTREVADIFIQDPHLASYYEHAVSEGLTFLQEDSQQNREKIAQTATNYAIKNLRTLLQEKSITIQDAESKLTPKNFGEFTNLVVTGSISSSAAREVLPIMLETGGDPSNIIEEKQLKQVSDELELSMIIEEVINSNVQAVKDFQKGKETSLQFLVGQVMAKTRGSANPEVARTVLLSKLK